MKRAPIKTLPSQEELRRLFDYEPDTGILRWKYVRPRAYRIKLGGTAGTVTDRGYLHIGIARRNYLAHRVIWKWMTGNDPVDQIDHIDGDRLNNRWSNLRQATNGQNRWNIRRQKNNKSGTTGVCAEQGRAWVAYIAAGRGQVRLGRFQTKTEAIAARREAVSRMHGDFARQV